MKAFQMHLRTVVAAAGLLAAIPVGRAQAQPPGLPDFNKVQIQATQLAPNFYRFEAVGVLAGNVGALVGPDGVFMVDAQYPQLTEKLVAAITQVSNGQIRFFLNTHQRPDHSRDADIAKMGAVLVARDELRARIAAARTPPPPGGLPMLTYRGQVTIHMNGEDIQLIPAANAQTDGDTMVYLPHADVLMTSDLYRSIQYPNIDRNNGGSLKGLIEALNAVIALAKPSTKIVPGHGPVVDKTAVVANRDMILTIRERVSALIAQGKSQEEVIAAKPIADFDAKVQQPGTTGDRFLGQVYAEIKAGK